MVRMIRKKHIPIAIRGRKGCGKEEKAPAVSLRGKERREAKEKGRKGEKRRKRGERQDSV